VIRAVLPLTFAINIVLNINNRLIYRNFMPYAL
jgi:hypothetical protein